MGRPSKLAHEMIFQSGADDLPLVIEIFRADEADDAVDQERIEGASDSVGAGFERELIDAVMRLRRERAALAGFEVHDVVADPGDVALAMMLEDSARWPSRSSARVMPKLRLAASVPATDWKSRSTGAPRSRAASCVVMWARQQVCVGIS